MGNSSESSDARRSENNSSESFLNQFGPLLILTSIFFLNFVSRITLAPLTPNIEIDLNLSHTDAGSLFFLISLGYFISLTGSGFISYRLNHKRTILLSNTALGFALIGTAFCVGTWTIRLGLFIVGIAAGLYLPSGMAMLTSLIPARRWGKAIAIHELAPNLGFVAAPLVSEAVMVWFSWRAVFLLFGCVTLIMSPVFYYYSRGGEFRGEAPNFVSFRQLFGNLSFWVMMLLFSLGIISTLGIYTMLPLYLVTEHSIDRNVANTLIALSRISGVIMAFVGGWATDRFWTEADTEDCFTPNRVGNLVFEHGVKLIYNLHCIFTSAGCRMFFSGGFCCFVFNCSSRIKEYCNFIYTSHGFFDRWRPVSGVYRYHRRYKQLCDRYCYLRWADYCRSYFSRPS